MPFFSDYKKFEKTTKITHKIGKNA